MINEHLKEERVRLGLNQPDFAAAAGAAKRTLIDWEKGATSPSAVQLSALSEIGVDVLYVLIGQRTNVPTSAHLAEEGRTATAGRAEIDEDLMRRIVTMLAKTAKASGRRWDNERLMHASVDVYKFLEKEEKVDDDKLERVLKLIVNR